MVRNLRQGFLHSSDSKGKELFPKTQFYSRSGTADTIQVASLLKPQLASIGLPPRKARGPLVTQRPSFVHASRRAHKDRFTITVLNHKPIMTGGNSMKSKSLLKYARGHEAPWQWEQGQPIGFAPISRSGFSKCITRIP